MALFPITGSTEPIVGSLTIPGSLANAGLRRSN
jgi:hypothetical protein